MDGIGFEPATWQITALFQTGYSLLKNYNKRDPSQYEWKKGGDFRNDRLHVNGLRSAKRILAKVRRILLYQQMDLPFPLPNLGSLY